MVYLWLPVALFYLVPRCSGQEIVKHLPEKGLKTK